MASNSKDRTRKAHDDSLPMYEGTLWMLATRAVKAVKDEAGLGNKVRGFTRELGHMGQHVHRQIKAMSPLGRVLMSAGFVLLGAAIALGAYFGATRPRTGALRSQIRAEMAANDYVAARRDLERLRVASHQLSRPDREELAAPIQAHLQSMEKQLRAEIDADRKAKHWDDALTAVDKLDALDVDTEGALFLRAEVLRGAGRDTLAAEQYARYVQLYPDTSHTDDAMFWQALYLRSKGDTARARQMLESLRQKFPQSDFTASAKRVLAEIKKRGR
jgi:tetratricopeptide (TPR) repeat protein